MDGFQRLAVKIERELSNELERKVSTNSNGIAGPVIFPDNRHIP